MPTIKKIALIEPQPPGYHVYSSIALPRLGLPLLGAILKKRGIEVSIYCQAFEPLNYSDILNADLVGISTTTSTAPEGYKIAGRVKEAGIPVMMGGSHVSFMADEALQYADFCVRGEGEYTLMELVDAIESGSGFESILGLSYKIDGVVRHNPDRGLVKDLDALPFPDLSLIRGREKMKITPIETSRGCPFDCSFCSVTKMFGRGCRERSVESVLDEIERLQPKSIFFYDDNFTANRERTKQLLKGMLERKITASWSAQARVDVVRDKELLQLMKRTNCYMLYMGLESVNPDTLLEYNKRQSVEDIVGAVRILHEHGIMVHGMFVFGAENDTAADLKTTVDFALRHSIDTVQFMILTPLPGTLYFNQMAQEGRLLTREWNFYDGQHVVYQPSKMSPYELQKETFKAMKQFYNIRECVKMVFGVDFLKFAVKFNVHLLLGRWRTAKRLLDLGTMRARYRAYGHFLIRRFESANSDFGERIKALAERARKLKTSGSAFVRESGFNVRQDQET